MKETKKIYYEMFRFESNYGERVKEFTFYLSMDYYDDNTFLQHPSLVFKITEKDLIDNSKIYFYFSYVELVQLLNLLKVYPKQIINLNSFNNKLTIKPESNNLHSLSITTNDKFNMILLNSSHLYVILTCLTSLMNNFDTITINLLQLKKINEIYNILNSNQNENTKKILLEVENKLPDIVNKDETLSNPKILVADVEQLEENVDLNLQNIYNEKVEELTKIENIIDNFIEEYEKKSLDLSIFKKFFDEVIISIPYNKLISNIILPKYLITDYLNLLINVYNIQLNNIDNNFTDRILFPFFFKVSDYSFFVTKEYQDFVKLMINMMEKYYIENDNKKYFFIRILFCPFWLTGIIYNTNTFFESKLENLNNFLKMVNTNLSTLLNNQYWKKISQLWKKYIDTIQRETNTQIVLDYNKDINTTVYQFIRNFSFSDIFENMYNLKLVNFVNDILEKLNQNLCIEDIDFNSYDLTIQDYSNFSRNFLIFLYCFSVNFQDKNKNYDSLSNLFVEKLEDQSLTKDYLVKFIFKIS